MNCFIITTINISNILLYFLLNGGISYFLCLQYHFVLFPALISHVILIVQSHYWKCCHNNLGWIGERTEAIIDPVKFSVVYAMIIWQHDVDISNHWQLMLITRGQRQVMHQLDNLSNLVHEQLAVLTQQDRRDNRSRFLDLDLIGKPVLILLVGGISFFLLKNLSRNWIEGSTPFWIAPEFFYMSLGDCHIGLNSWPLILQCYRLSLKVTHDGDFVGGTVLFSCLLFCFFSISSAWAINLYI